MSTSSTRPKSVVLAVKLLFLAAAIAFGREIIDSGDLFVGAGLLLVAACLCVVIHRIYLGRNWARVIFLLIVVVGMSVSVPEMIAVARTAPFSAAFSISLLAIQLFALYLLFTSPGSVWFKKPNALS